MVLHQGNKAKEKLCQTKRWQDLISENFDL